jgi:hypothetical protein
LRICIIQTRLPSVSPGLTGLLKGPGQQYQQYLFSEIAFPPFGLIMSVGGHPPIDHRLCNITHFGEFSYRTWDIVYMKLPVLHVTTVLPGDFRTVDEVKRDVADNRKIGDMLLNAPVPSS